MNEETTKRIIGNSKNFVIIGEAGSGKTEVSLNLAAEIRRLSDRPVHLFDMDQTKPIFRARDSIGAVSRSGVIFHYQKQFMDAPVVAAGVIERLRDPGSTVILDIGGGAYGSHMIGQFAEYLNGADTRVIYLINPYRPWSGSRSDIEETISRTAGAAHLEKLFVAANPNYGAATAAGDVVRGVEKLQAMLPNTELEFVCAKRELAGMLGECGLPVFALDLNTDPEWLT